MNEPHLRALRGIAVFEAVKGVLAIVASVGLLSLVHRDVHQLAVDLIGHIGLDPGGRYPGLLLHYADVLQDANLRTLMLVAGIYVIVRLTEAWGLWFGRRWGEWLGALSGVIYLPFEWRHLVHKPDLFSAVVLLLNLAIVAFLAWQLKASGGARPAA